MRLAALPADASAEDVDVDPGLPFLDAFVQRALAGGAAPYIPCELSRPSYPETWRVHPELFSFNMASLCSHDRSARPWPCKQWQAFGCSNLAN